VVEELTCETQTHSMVISYANLYAILGMKLCYNEIKVIPCFCENLSLS